MKHYIIVKYKDKNVTEKIKVPVKALFERTLVIEGINAVEVKTCCIDRENRYDMMITIDMEKEARGMVQKLMTGDRQGYSTLTGTSAVRSMKTSMRYVLFPVWVMTYQGEKTEAYYYMMNGQTGSVCGKLPLNRRKLFFVSLLTGILIFTLMCAGGAFLW